jgi:hypothetical protein
MTKIAGYRMLKDSSDLTAKEIASITRSQIGSPDFLAGGKYRVLYNNVWLFSNASMQGIRASYKAYQKNKSRYLWKLGRGALLNKWLLLAIGAGVFGPKMKSILEGIPDHDKANYTIVPLGHTPDGKSVYFRFPMSHTEQIASSLFWSLSKGINEKAMVESLKTVHGHIPFTNLNPLIDIPRDWINFSMGNNPYDSFRREGYS